MIRLLKEMKTEDRRMALLCILLVGGQVYLDLKLPDYTKEITTLVSMENSVLSAYFIAGGKMLACAFASAVLSVIVGYFAAKIAADFSFDIREKVFDKVAAFGSGEVKKFSAASLITRTTNDITQIQMVIAMGNGFPVPGHDLCAERADAGHILDRRVPDQRYCHTSGRHGGGADRRRRYPRVYIPGTV